MYFLDSNVDEFSRVEGLNIEDCGNHKICS